LHGNMLKWPSWLLCHSRRIALGWRFSWDWDSMGHLFRARVMWGVSPVMYSSHSEIESSNRRRNLEKSVHQNWRE
jgi:hypothetical protein